jgi:hypothetical protein
MKRVNTVALWQIKIKKLSIGTLYLITLNQRVVGSNPSASTISTYSACFFPNGLFSLTIFRFRIAAKLTHAR